MKRVIAFNVTTYLHRKKLKLLELLKKLKNSFKYQPDCTGEPRLWWVFQLHPDFWLGHNLRTVISLTCVALSLPYSCLPVFMRSKLKELQCALTGLLFCKTRVQAWTGYCRQHLSCDKDIAFSTLNEPMNFRKQALPNPIFSIKHTVPLQWRLFFQIHFLFV